ncbi:MAG: hypothetical protein HUU23_09335 [Caldilineales bacterium]|nr:hypothetical protein [Caldilineales bacterium]
MPLSFPASAGRSQAAPWQRGALILLLALLVSAPLLRSAQAGDSDRPLETRVISDCRQPAALGLLHVGVGLDQAQSAIFQVADLPPAAEVVHAWLYWNGNDEGNNAAQDDPDLFNPLLHDGDPTVTLNGAQVPDPQRIGGPAAWIMPGVPERDSVYAYAYRAEVSTIVAGNGHYTLAGMDDFDVYNNGAELVILYREAGLPLRHVALADGLDIAFGDNAPPSGPGTHPVIFSFDEALVKRTAKIHLFVGGAGVSGATAFWYRSGSDPAPDPATFILAPQPGTQPHPDAYRIGDLFTGANNQNAAGYWDSYPVQISIPAGATWLAVQVESQNTHPVAARAALDWVGATLHMPLFCAQRAYLPLFLR